MRNTMRLKNLFWLLLTGVVLAGCSTVGLAHESTFESVFNQEPSDQSRVGRYDSADTAIVKAVITEQKQIELLNVELNKSYTLDYDGATLIYDKYYGAMSMPQISVGDIVDVWFMKDARKLAKLQLSPEAFIYDSISKYSVNGQENSAAIGGENYRLKDSTLILSEGDLVEVSDVVSRDVVSVQGLGHNILSIVVEKGHGYLKLDNDSYVIGGWIEAGQSVIQQITDDMLLTVPEGTLDVHITAKGIDTIRKVVIERNKETVIDLSDLEIDEARMGQVYFNVTPASAKVYVDGEEADIGKAVEMEYGLHQIVCEAAGYDTITQHIKVSQEIASLTITMDETRDVPDYYPSPTPGVSDNSLIAGAYRVYIDSPTDVEVYLDNIYMGISPVHFPKVPGSHTITLRKVGYVTRSYTIQIDSEESDVTYSFSDLEKVNNSVSGNTLTPSPTPSSSPGATPSTKPSPTPSADPTPTPSTDSTPTPSADPTPTPSGDPTSTPSADPTSTPGGDPTSTPSADPTSTPGTDPTSTPGAESTPSAAPASTPEGILPPGSDPEAGSGSASTAQVSGRGKVIKAKIPVLARYQRRFGTTSTRQR